MSEQDFKQVMGAGRGANPDDMPRQETKRYLTENFPMLHAGALSALLDAVYARVS